MNKPIKPNISFPSGFALNGQKTDFTQQKIQNGFNPVEPDILAGDNLNKFIDDTYKSITYSNSGVADLYRSAVVYDSGETYYQNSIVFNVDNNGKVLLYLSKTDNNVGNSLNDANYWEVIQLGAVRNIGEIVSSVLPLSDAGLHLLDGALISGSGSYTEFVTYILELYTANPTANYFTTEAAWQSSVNAYGVCGKFVVDTVNNTVRLPKITGIIEGTTDVTALGDLISAGLPNITGKSIVYFGDGTIQPSTGAFSETDVTDFYKAGTGFVRGSAITLDASRSNSIYGNSNTVQPQAVKVLYYIVVSTSTKTDIQVDIDNIATDLNGKADTDLSNITATAKEVICHNAMPADDSYGIDLSNTTPPYTATADGYFYVVVQTGSGAAAVYAQNTTVSLQSYALGSAGAYIMAYVPVAKGQSMNYAVTGSIASTVGRYFFKCIGET